ncbi:MAG: B12-binding domain-containing radical SAM protein [Nitrospirae bacterium]|nr:B12-binding domain-containing radical SAM protein [Nitrospirota bacterium]
MRVVFYDNGYETFGVQYLISVLKEKGHDVRLFFDSSFARDYLAQDFFLTSFFSFTAKQVCDAICAHSPEVVCFSVYTIFYQHNLSVIRLIKQRLPNVKIVCGGFHATLLPEVILENDTVDFVVVGEAEISLPLLLEKIQSTNLETLKALPAEQLQGVWSVSNGSVIKRGLSAIPHDLNALPFPEKTMYYKTNPYLSVIYTIIAGRGCFYGCTYCNSSSMKNLYHEYNERYFRTRSVDNVIAELKHAREKFNPRYVMFFDDVFAARKDWLEEFSVKYKKEVGLPFYCQTSPLIHNEKSLQLLSESGCCLLEFGFQSANEQVRKEILNRHEKNEAMASLVIQAVSQGMFTELDMIANLPGETHQHITEALDFIATTHPNWVNLAFLQFHPKTPITDIAIAKQMLKAEDKQEIEHGLRASSMRLLSQVNMDKQYRILPFQIFAAFYFNKEISAIIIQLTQNTVVSEILSRLASPFLYLSRILLSYTDKRDFLVRHHVGRSLHAAKNVLLAKVFAFARL